MSQGTAVVVGVGAESGLGAGLARRFALEGLRVFISGRTEARLQAVAASIRQAKGTVIAKAGDSACEAHVAALFDQAGADNDLELVVYNVGQCRRRAGPRNGGDALRKPLAAQCLGRISGRPGSRPPLSAARKRNDSLHRRDRVAARPPFLAFASAKAALRAVAQGLAREFEPHGIHVAHIVIDGVIQGEKVAANFPDYVRSKGENGLLAVDAIADAYWALFRQTPSAWTHELDLRPFKEPF